MKIARVAVAAAKFLIFSVGGSSFAIGVGTEYVDQAATCNDTNNNGQSNYQIYRYANECCDRDFGHLWRNYCPHEHWDPCVCESRKHHSHNGVGYGCGDCSHLSTRRRYYGHLCRGTQRSHPGCADSACAAGCGGRCAYAVCSGQGCNQSCPDGGCQSVSCQSGSSCQAPLKVDVAPRPDSPRMPISRNQGPPVPCSVEPEEVSILSPPNPSETIESSVPTDDPDASDLSEPALPSNVIPAQRPQAQKLGRNLIGNLSKTRNLFVRITLVPENFDGEFLRDVRQTLHKNRTTWFSGLLRQAAQDHRQVSHGFH